MLCFDSTTNYLYSQLSEGPLEKVLNATNICALSYSKEVCDTLSSLVNPYEIISYGVLVVGNFLTAEKLTITVG